LKISEERTNFNFVFKWPENRYTMIMDLGIFGNIDGGCIPWNGTMYANTFWVMLATSVFP
jgi:hypothetical protein